MNKDHPKVAPASDGEEAQAHYPTARRQWWLPTGPRSGFLVDVDTIGVQVIRDAFRDAFATHWLHRAEQLAAGLSRPTDRPGLLTSEQIAERDQRIRADIERCLQHARLLGEGDPFPEDLAAVLAEVA